MIEWRSSSAIVFALAVTLSGPSTVLCQSLAEPQGQEHSAQQGQERVIEMFLDHATAELDLTVEQRAGLDRIMRETMGRRAELARSQAQVRRQVRDALSDPATVDQEFRRLVGAMLDARRQEIELLDWQEGRLFEVLTPRQTLRFMLLQQQLAQRIEDMRKARNR
jgi:Spy/CpxP family protein refolding chaperone